MSGLTSHDVTLPCCAGSAAAELQRLRHLPAPVRGVFLPLPHHGLHVANHLPPQLVPRGGGASAGYSIRVKLSPVRAQSGSIAPTHLMALSLESCKWSHQGRCCFNKAGFWLIFLLPIPVCLLLYNLNVNVGIF